METQIHRIFMKKWAQVGKYNLNLLTFKTKWKYYFWIGKYELKCVFDDFSPNYHI